MQEGWGWETSQSPHTGIGKDHPKLPIERLGYANKKDSIV